jgi:nitrogen fixation NifU-like protein
MNDLRELYQEVILDHNKHPRHFGVLKDATHQAQGKNPLCGDEVTIYLKVNDGKIEDVSFEGHGCAISTASASLMTEALLGKTLEEAEALFQTFHTLITGSSPPKEVPGKLAVFAGVRDYPTRVKCAILAWHTLEAALAGKTQPVSTEETS